MTVYFGADVDAHRAAYLTGVLAVFTFAALAAVVDVWLKLAKRIRLEALGNRRHAVRLFHREGNRLRIGSVAANQRDVGAMQRRDHARYPRRTGACKNLPGEIGGGRVRNSVMRVNDVEIFLPRDLDDLRRQREDVLRLTKKRIAGRLDAMERQVRLIVTETKGRLAAQDVDTVSA